MLDEVGRSQADSLAHRLAGVELSGAVTSPLERTQQTMQILLDGRPGVTTEEDRRLGECDYGEWSGRSLKELARDPLWKVVQSHPTAAAFPGGESLAHMQHRAVSSIREWNERWGESGVYLVVSHGDVIKAILADALGMHLDHFQRLRIDPCSLSIVDYTAMRPFVERINDTGGALPAPSGRSRRKERSSDAAVGGGAGS
jgi:probable phosphoglycerate mutase